jgi:hypothetical protein
LGIFDVDSGRAKEFAGILRDMENLAVRMIQWFIEERLDDSRGQPVELWKAFVLELKSKENSQSMSLED